MLVDWGDEGAGCGDGITGTRDITPQQASPLCSPRSACAAAVRNSLKLELPSFCLSDAALTIQNLPALAHLSARPDSKPAFPTRSVVERRWWRKRVLGTT